MLWEPNLDRLVHAPRCHYVYELVLFCGFVVRSSAIGLCGFIWPRRPPPCEASHEVPVRLQGLDTSPGREFPYAYCVVVRGGEEELPGRVKHERAYPIIMASL